MDISFEKHKQDLSSELDDALSLNQERKVPIRVINTPERNNPENKEEEKSKQSSAEKEQENFVANPELIAYVKSLIDKGRKLNSLKFDLGFVESNEHIKKILSNSRKLGNLSSEEYQTALGFLDELDSNPENKNEPVQDGSENKDENESAQNDNEDKPAEISQVESNLEANEVVQEIPPEITQEDVEEEESMEIIDNNLTQARSEYAKQLIEWKNKNRKKKSGIQKLFMDLGMEKNVPLAERPQELQDAERDYIDAKERKAFEVSDVVKQAEEECENLQNLILESIPPLEKGIVTKAFEKWTKLPAYQRILLSSALMTGTSMAFGTIGATSAAAYLGYRAGRGFGGAMISKGTGKVMDKIFGWKNKEDRQGMMSEYGTNMNLDNFAEKEQELMRAFEKEQSAKKRQRLYKAGASLITGIASTKIGANLGQSALEHYIHPNGQVSGETNVSDNISKHNASVAEHVPDKPSAGIISNIKRFFLGGKKINVGGNVSEHIPESKPSLHMETRVEIPDKPSAPILEDTSPKVSVSVEPQPSEVEISQQIDHSATLETKPSISAQEHIVGKPNISEQEISAEVSVSHPENIIEQAVAPKVSPEILETKVELSPRGFIQDIENLKKEIIKNYGGDESKVPQGIKENILDKHSTELAQKLGLWNIKEHTSGMGLAHEHLELDAKGNIVLDHLDGKHEVLFDTNTGDVHQFAGTMKDFDAPKAAVHETIPTNTAETAIIPDNPAEFPINRQGSILGTTASEDSILAPTTPEINPSSLSEYHIPYQDSFIDVIQKSGYKTVVFNNTEIAHEYSFGKNWLLQLDDKFQDGVQYKDIREAFATAFKNTVDADHLGKMTIPIQFKEGGIIHIVAGLDENHNGIKVLLNGKEIGNGIINNNHQIENLHMVKNLKGGWFLADTVYERAFKQVKIFAKGMKDDNHPFPSF